MKTIEVDEKTYTLYDFLAAKDLVYFKPFGILNLLVKVGQLNELIKEAEKMDENTDKAVVHEMKEKLEHTGNEVNDLFYGNMEEIIKMFNRMIKSPKLDDRVEIDTIQHLFANEVVTEIITRMYNKLYNVNSKKE